MPYPSNVSVVTVTGHWTNSDGTTPAKGTVTFTPNAVLQDGTSTPANIVLPKPLTVSLVNGAINVQLMATDDTHLSPTGWVYTVTENIDSQSATRTYSIQLPRANTPVDLSTLTPLVTPPALIGYVALSAVGAPSGVASLDGTGNVPLAQLGNAPAAPVQSVNGRTGAVVLAASDVGAVPTTAVAAANGVASLDASGHVPQAQLATAIGISLVNAIIFGS